MNKNKDEKRGTDCEFRALEIKSKRRHKYHVMTNALSLQIALNKPFQIQPYIFSITHRAHCTHHVLHYSLDSFQRNLLLSFVFICANCKSKLRLKMCSDCSVINTLNGQNALRSL